MPKAISTDELIETPRNGSGSGRALLKRKYFRVQSDGTIWTVYEYEASNAGKKYCERIWRGRSRAHSARVGTSFAGEEDTVTTKDEDKE